MCCWNILHDKARVGAAVCRATAFLLYRRMVLGRVLRVEGRQLRRNGPVLLRRDVPRPLVDVHRHPVLEGEGNVQPPVGGADAGASSTGWARTVTRCWFSSPRWY